MKKTVLIVTSSLRRNSNSDMLAASFKDGVKAAGHTVELVSLKGKRIDFCRGCMACKSTHKCMIKDDAVEIAEKIKRANVLVFATPIYYYELSGQLKTLLDRCNPLFATDYTFRDVYLLATAADDDESTMDGPIKGMKGWVSCFEKSAIAGTVFAGGVDEAGEIQGHIALQTAYEMGKAIR